MMPSNYEIRVRGRVDDEIADALGMVARVEPVDTVLRGTVSERGGLQDVLQQLQDLGLELLDIRRVPPASG